MAVNSVTGVGEYNAYCQSCGRKYKASQLRRRPEDNLMVCPDDWEPIHPQKYWRVIPDSKALPFVLSNDDQDLDAGAGVDIAGNTFPPSTNQDAVTRVYYNKDIFNSASVSFTVDKAYVNGPVTLPDGVTLTVNHSIIVREGGTETTFGAADYTGANSGW